MRRRRFGRPFLIYCKRVEEDSRFKEKQEGAGVFMKSQDWERHQKLAWDHGAQDDARLVTHSDPGCEISSGPDLVGDCLIGNVNLA